MILSDTKKAKSKYAIKHDAELTVHDEGYVFSPSIFPFIFFLLLLNFKYTVGNKTVHMFFSFNKIT